MSRNILNKTSSIPPTLNPIDLLDNWPGPGGGKATYLPKRCDAMVRSLASTVKIPLEKVALSSLNRQQMPRSLQLLQQPCRSPMERTTKRSCQCYQCQLLQSEIRSATTIITTGHHLPCNRA